MDSDRSQFPCMPMPIMPKRTRSLAAMAAGAGVRLCGIGTSPCAASDAPAAAALVPRNSRRDQLLFFTAPPCRMRWRGLGPHYGGSLGLLAPAAILPAVFSSMRAALTLVVLVATAPPALAQSEDRLRVFFEGKTVRLKMEMPGTEDGVDVYPGTAH